MEAKALLLVALGGALGASLRYGIGLWLTSDSFPWATLTVNLVGSLLLGSLTCAALVNGVLSEEATLFAGIGLLGAFTTLSTYSVDSIRMYQAEAYSYLAGYVLATSIGGPILALIGWKVTELILD
ncbi:MAG: fluoride efflux transporter CrcB [Methanobacteriota archaeon]|nr:MAG: fluoride efflux transporter CrcB [Euryarchaeota archaeon]HIK78359.1 CrcB family protein [Candidatus Poseidoniales archaeon]